MSYAPELDEKQDFVRYLVKNDIIPSAVIPVQHIQNLILLKKPVKAGNTLFNAMPQLHHRNPGVLGEALTNDEIYVEVIADKSAPSSNDY